MIASEIAIPFCLRQSSSHGSRIACTKNRDAARFLTSNRSSLWSATASLDPARFSGDVAKRGVARVLSRDVASPCRSMELLGAWDDEYDGVVVDPASLPSAANAFASQLQSSLAYWRSKGKKGIWLKLFEDQAHLVPIAIQVILSYSLSLFFFGVNGTRSRYLWCAQGKPRPRILACKAYGSGKPHHTWNKRDRLHLAALEGFVFHDAEAGYVMMTYWIPSEPCLLPSGPSHQIGIAGFVINHNNEILVVKEKCSCSCSGVWKLPTGFINKFEDLFSGAVREVKEETGIDTEFLELVAFRHVHRVAFEKSDLLFVCMLHPLSFEIQIDETEIQDAKWIGVDELLSQQFYKEDEMLKRVMEICLATYHKKYSGFVAHQLVSKFDGKMSFLYYKDVTT